MDGLGVVIGIGVWLWLLGYKIEICNGQLRVYRKVNDEQ